MLKQNNNEEIQIDGTENGGGAEKFELCIACGVETAVASSTPVDKRKYYIHGCGQLCDACAVKLNYEAIFSDETPTNEILLGLHQDSDR